MQVLFEDGHDADLLPLMGIRAKEMAPGCCGIPACRGTRQHGEKTCSRLVQKCNVTKRTLDEMILSFALDVVNTEVVFLVAVVVVVDENQDAEKNNLLIVIILLQQKSNVTKSLIKRSFRISHEYMENNR